MKSQKPASEILKLFTPIPQKLVSLSNIDRSLLQNDTVTKQIEEIKKQICDKGRLLIRPSGTEPVIRIMVEAEEPKIIDDTINEIVKILNSK